MNMETTKLNSIVFGDIKTDADRINQLRNNLANAYLSACIPSIEKAAWEIKRYVDSGLDDNDDGWEDVIDYHGDDPMTLARQYIVRVYHDRYLDDDEDQTYINTGVKRSMRTIPEQLSLNF